MKRISTLLMFFVMSNMALAQNCTVSINPSAPISLCGQDVALEAIGVLNTPVFTEDFNTSSFGPGWSTTATVLYNNPCTPSLDGTPSLWFGNVALPRTVETNAFDLSCGGQICFDLDFSQDESTLLMSDCDDPDQIDEGVFLQYSAGGGPWTTIFYFEPDELNTAPWYEWTNFCFTLPAGAWSATTQFRWTQPNATATFFDHWGIDNVVVSPTGCGYWYDWDNLGPTMDPANQTVNPTMTTTYEVIHTDGVDSCTTNVTVTVDPFVVTAQVDNSPINCGDCANLFTDITNIPTDTCVTDHYAAGPPGVTTLTINYASCSPAGTEDVGLLIDALTTSPPFPMDCGVLYDFDLVIDGVTVLANQCTVTGFDLAPYLPVTTIELVSNDIAGGIFVELEADVYTVYRDIIPVDYSWTPTGGVTSPTSQNTQVCPTATTTYTGTITDPVSGCTGTNDVMIVVNPGSDATISAVAPLCITDPSLNLSAVDPGGTWSGAGITNGALGTFDPATAGVGTHVISYSIAGPCGDTQNESIVVTNCALPIELSRFEAKATNERTVRLDWTTETELNNEYFTLERSTDAIHFESFAEVPGALNSTHRIDYYYYDYEPRSGISYYRLKQTDTDGSYAYSDIRVVSLSGEEVIKVFPNPASDIVNIEMTASGQKIVSIVSSDGKIVKEMETNQQKVGIPLSGLANGVYQIRIENTDGIVNKMFIKGS